MMVDVFSAGFAFALMITFSLFILATVLSYEYWRQSIVAVVLSELAVGVLLILAFPYIVLAVV